MLRRRSTVIVLLIVLGASAPARTQVADGVTVGGTFGVSRVSLVDDDSASAPHIRGDVEWGQRLRWVVDVGSFGGVDRIATGLTPGTDVRDRFRTLTVLAGLKLPANRAGYFQPTIGIARHRLTTVTESLNGPNDVRRESNVTLAYGVTGGWRLRTRSRLMFDVEAFILRSHAGSETPARYVMGVQLVPTIRVSR